MSGTVKFAIAGGGTGGHIYPGIAAAQEITRRGNDVFFLGTAKGMEATIVPGAGFRFHAVEAAPMKRGRIGQNIFSLAKNLRGVGSAISVLRKERPCVILGTGGYVSFAACVAAWLLRIPVALHEQNAVPGLANRVLARVASVIMTAWPRLAGSVSATCGSVPADYRTVPTESRSIPESRQSVDDKHVREPERMFRGAGRMEETGLPVRADFFSMTRDEARVRMHIPRDARVLLVFGGSRGASSLNQSMASIARKLDPVLIIWATGNDQYESILTKLGSSCAHVRLLPYIDDMPAAFHAADLVVSRAGAMTLAELAACGRPSILVPFPHATEDHQTANARRFVDSGASRMIRDADLEKELYAGVMEIFSDEILRGAMAKNAAALAKPAAAARIVDILEGIAK